MENGHCDLTGHGTGGLGANEPCSAFEIPSEMVFLPKNAVFPVSKGIFPFWSKIFLPRKMIFQVREIIFLPSPKFSLPRENIFLIRKITALPSPKIFLQRKMTDAPWFEANNH